MTKVTDVRIIRPAIRHQQIVSEKNWAVYKTEWYTVKENPSISKTRFIHT